MKKIFKAGMLIIPVSLMLVACGNGGEKSSEAGTAFAPKERTSSFSDEERQAAIAAKKESIQIDMNMTLNSRGIKLNVLPPTPQGEDITEAVAERMAVKMLQITTLNGIGGIGNVPGFALTACVNQTGRSATGTAPQKMVVKYDVTFQVMNVMTGDVYATTTQEIMGVGNSFIEANNNAANEIKNTPEVQKMLQLGSERILFWFNDNLAAFKKQVDAAVGQKDYALALAMVESVPQQATAAFSYAEKKQPELLLLLQKQHAADELAAMKSAIANAGATYSADVVAHMQMIPTGSSEYKEAKSLLTAYEKKIETANAELKAKAAANEAYARKLAETEAAREHEMELAKLEADKIKAKYEAESSSVAIELATRKRVADEGKGFWSRLGSRIIDAVDSLSSSEE